MPSSKSSLDKRDIYYRLGKSAGYRARSAWKLIHLDEEFGLFEGVSTVVDLCAAPGSWSQVVGERMGLADGSARLVSLDLQPMAPLRHTTTLQCDITIPSTIPLVLSHLRPSAPSTFTPSSTEIRKADLVICDGAPDVTGVHDLDAYLHYQLLLAAITLTLTILRKGGTAVYKVFLSPMDPRGEMLKSQVAPLFGGLMGDLEVDMEECGDADEAEAVNGDGVYGKVEDERRQHGVWMCKPRSSRAGSGEAFLVCRGFDPSLLPLPATYSVEALSELEKQTTGTITLDSLSQLVSPNGEDSTANWTDREWKRWQTIKGWLGTGSLSGGIKSAPKTAQAPHAAALATTPERPSTLSASIASPIITHTEATPGSTSQSQCADVPPPSAGLGTHSSLRTLTRNRGHTIDSPTMHASSNNNAPGRKSSGDSELSMSPTMPHHLVTGSNGSQWSGPSPLPSPITLNGQPDWLAVTQAQGGGSTSADSNALSPRLSAHAVARRSIDEGYKRLSGGASGHSILGDGGSSSASASGTWSHLNLATPSADGAISPALSNSSKTDLFFKNTEALPTPPKPLNRAPSLGQSALNRSGSLGKGLPPHLRARREFEGVDRDRAVTMPGTPVFGALGMNGNSQDARVVDNEHDLPPPVPVSAGSRTAGLFSTDFSATPIIPASGSSSPSTHRSGEDVRMRSASTPYPALQRPGLSAKEVDAIGQASHFRRPSSIFNENSHHDRSSTLHGHEHGHSPAMSTFSGFSQGFPDSPLVDLPSDRSMSLNLNINGPIKRPFNDRRESQIVREWRRAPEEEGLDVGDILEPLGRPRRESRPGMSTATSSSSTSSDDVKVKRDRELDIKRRASGMIDTLGRAFLKTGQHLGMTSVKENEAANGAQAGDSHDSPVDVKGKRKWRLEKRLGDGAFSAVWLAIAIDDGDSARKGVQPSSRVALKLLPRHLTSTNERTHISFLREVEVLSSIRHPNVVGFVDDFETQGYYALALETAEGGELFECVQSKAWAALVRSSGGNGPTEGDDRQRVGDRLVRRIMRELCSAVGFLHEVGIVHRDIKLENILLTQNLVPHLETADPLSTISPGPLIKLTDFGLSRFIDADAPLLETRCGSESFAAPEIIMGRAYDGRDTDSWAVGVVGYAIVVGELPFDALPTSAGVSTPGGFLEDEKESRRKRMMRIAKGQYAFPEGVGSEGVRGLVGKLLVRDPKKRARVEDVVKSDDWLRNAGQKDGQSDVQEGYGRGPGWQVDRPEGRGWTGVAGGWVRYGRDN